MKHRTYKNFFITMIIIVLISSVISLFVPVFLQIWNREADTFSANKIVLIVVALVISNLLSLLLIILREKYAKTYNQKNFLAYMKDYCNLNYNHIITEGPINLLDRIAMAINSIYAYMTGANIQIWASVVTSVVCIILMALSSVFIALLMAIYIPISYFGCKLLNKELARRSEMLQKTTGAEFQRILTYVQEPDYCKQLDDYSPLLRKIDKSADVIYTVMSKVNILAQTGSSAIRGIGTLIQNLIFIIVIYNNYSGANSSPFVILLSMIIFPLFFSSISVITNSNLSKADYMNAVSLRNELIKNAEEELGKNVDKIKSIEFNISEINVPGLKIKFNVNGKVQTGQIARINGPSGSGKSTVAKNLVKFMKSNGIKINGMDVNDISPKSIRSRVEYISQNIPIINGTLRENVLFGKDENIISENNLKNNPLLKSILQNKTLDTEILTDGANLSGGEKQKIGIIRALLSNPDVLILDEVCSNIDFDVSQEIYQMLKDDKKERITIIITHDQLPDGLIDINLN